MALSDYYVIGIVQSFKNISDYMQDGHKVQEAFSFEFPDNKFVYMSFYNHLQYWKNTSQESKDTALAFRHSCAGLRSVFMQDNLHPYAKRKAQKKWVQHSQQHP